jgi:cytochrome P450
MDQASWHDELLLWHNRPLTTLLMKAVAGARVGLRLPYVGYVVNSPDLACRLLNHPGFRSTGHGSMDELITGLVGPGALFNEDGPGHRELRSRLMEVFSRGNVEALVNRAGADVLCELRDELRQGRTIDVTLYSQRLVGRAITHALGLRVSSEAIYGQIASLAGGMTRMLGLDRLEPSDQDLRKAALLYHQLLDLARDTYGTSQRRAPATVISKLQSAGLSFEQAGGILAVVLLAGTETALVALPRLMALLIDSGEIRRLSERRELLSNAVVEGLRLVVPTHVIIRSVAEDALLAGIRFKRGERVIVILYNALRQSRYFADPGRFNLEREVEPRFKHLCFGAGPHFCLGFGLAHREIETFIEAFLDLPGQLRIVGRKYPRGLCFPSYSSLLVRLDPNR